MLKRTLPNRSGNGIIYNKIPSPSRRPYPPACKPYGLEAEPEASIPLCKRGKESECKDLLRNYNWATRINFSFETQSLFPYTPYIENESIEMV